MNVAIMNGLQAGNIAQELSLLNVTDYALLNLYARADERSCMFGCARMRRYEGVASRNVTRLVQDARGAWISVVLFRLPTFLHMTFGMHP